MIGVSVTPGCWTSLCLLRPSGHPLSLVENLVLFFTHITLATRFSFRLEKKKLLPRTEK